MIFLLKRIWCAFGSMALLLGPSAVEAGSVTAIAVEPFGTPLERLLESGACQGCDLRDADLRGHHLIGADLRAADLRGAKLNGVNLEGADLSGAKLDGARLQGAMLSNADLSGTDLSHADLRDSVVINAYAPVVQTEGMQFAGSDLTGSHLIYGGGPDDEATDF